jgi:hypothetical protein
MTQKPIVRGVVGARAWRVCGDTEHLCHRVTPSCASAPRLVAVRYDLPDEFNFPHYFGVSLDALTADLVELLPGSYVALMLLIAFCEYVVRHYGFTYTELRHPTRRESLDETTAVFL